MATATKIHLTPSEAGIFHAPGITAESAAKASEILQENHEKFHMYFNDEGFHVTALIPQFTSTSSRDLVWILLSNETTPQNHIVHHILTIYALGASPEDIQKQYDQNISYQRLAGPVHRETVNDLADPEKRKKYLGKEIYSSDFQVFYQKEIERLGWEAALLEHVFKGDESADDMLVRLFMGFLHPLIHLGFGVEFKQPAIIAQALAQAATHDNWLAPFFHGAEEKAASTHKDPAKTKSLVELLDEIRADQKLSTAAHWEDGNKIQNGILERAPEEMIGYASQWSAGPEELEEKTAEMINAVAYYTAAAQHPPKQIKLDFYFLHGLNSSIFLPVLFSIPSLTPSSKSRLLTWKSRLDLAMYASRRSPPLLRSELQNYTPLQRTAGWEGIFERARSFPGDDGHVVKAVRAAAFGERYCGAREPMDAGMWLNVAQMAVESAETPGPPWVRSAGFERAWERVEGRGRLA